eukprot:CAMPEP_0197864860 /NCGR_PEP_ID=MMETSP1438-20131217/43332_1 /TAXON_ID=1461541 /ORGANISM="Pterosperma sp., Strain CCMP1384" /LENGTH=519 /DNA_ID=CAMNT_0043483235 /DNA_START=277 /DNA_END=1836 /DNA_ORIENTATION=-
MDPLSASIAAPASDDQIVEVLNASDTPHPFQLSAPPDVTTGSAMSASNKASGEGSKAEGGGQDSGSIPLVRVSNPNIEAKSTTSSKKWYFLAAVVIFAIGGAVGAVMGTSGGSSESESAPPETTAPAPAPAPPPPSTAVPAQSPTEVPTSAPIAPTPSPTSTGPAPTIASSLPPPSPSPSPPPPLPPPSSATPLPGAEFPFSFLKADGVLAGLYPATFPFENDNYVSAATLPGAATPSPGANSQVPSDFPFSFKKADGVLAGLYPATFPFENDNYVSAATLPGADGHDTIDPETNDIGGYAAISYTHCNIFEYEPFGVFTGGPSPCARVYQRLFFSYWSTPYTELIPINCTQAKVIIEGPFDGNFPGSDQVCDPATCCSYAHGHVHLGREWEYQQETWGERYQKYGCTWMTEPAYCQILHFNVNWCHEFYEYAREQGNKQVRPFMQPCINLFDYFLSQCSTFKVLGAKPLLQALKIEPDHYINSLSSAEANTALSVFYANDRVCTPIAEIHPDLFKKDT